MLPAVGAILVEFQPVRIVAAVLLRDVIAFLAIITRQDNDRADVFSLRSHSKLPRFRKKFTAKSW